MKCPAGHESDVIAKWDERAVPCPTCGVPTERIWKQSAAVNGDECDFYDPNFERRFTSKAEHDRVLKEHGLVRKVRHVGGKGGDKSAYTQRWDTCPAALLVSEEDRIARSREWDRVHGLTAPPRPVTLVAPYPDPVFSSEEQRALNEIASQVGL